MATKPSKTTSKKSTATTKSVVADTVSNEEVTTKNKTISTEIADNEDIDVKALIPNVSYYDKTTGKRYEWEERNQIEPMPFSVIKEMWRGHKGYFKSMYLRPNDERVVKKFGLEKTYSAFDFLVNPENYTRDKLDEIEEHLKKVNKDILYTVVQFLKNAVAENEISDIKVLRFLEKRLNITLIDLIK